MEVITKEDLLLINALSSRSYSGNKLLSNATTIEKQRLTTVKSKLKVIAEYFSESYKNAYGPFETSISTGNDIAIGGTNLKRIWSGIFKGASNKQYAAQISFVMNPVEACLNVGFYFGSASGHSKNKEQRDTLERQLNNLGISLANLINSDNSFQEKYNSLFDFGFKAFSKGTQFLSDDWRNHIKIHTDNSNVIAKIYPNDFDIIENSTIGSYVSQVMFLMGGIPATNAQQSLVIPPSLPSTPEQRAKKAERLAQIGLKGELFVMGLEKNKLITLGINNSKYPKHVALESDSYGYDVLSLNKDNEEIYIEVKTTTRLEKDKQSRSFFISSREHDVFSKNKIRYKLYRVYDVENKPNIEEIDLDTVTKKPDGYICEY